MDIEQPQARIRIVGHFIVPNQLTIAIIKQIQFYFSMANLATDDMLRQIIMRERKGWVRIKRLLTFRKLKNIIDQAFNFELTENQRERVLCEALKDSKIVKISGHKIKIKQKVVWSVAFQKVLYFQGIGMNEPTIFQIIKQYGISQDSVIVKKGDGWCFVQFKTLNSTEMMSLFASLQTNQSLQQIGTVMRMETFLAYKKQLQNILKNIEHTNTHQSQHAEVGITPKRIYNYSDFVLPQKLQKMQDENIKNTANKQKNKVLESYTPPQNYPRNKHNKTRQQYESFRTKKIQQWRMRKNQKLQNQHPTQQLQNPTIKK